MVSPLPNYARMMQIIETVFATRKDPDQLQMDEADRNKLQKIHPSCLSELADEKGPLIWALMIPTSHDVMLDFIAGKLTEQGILKRTQPGSRYDCIYLCSVSALPEVRGKGKTKKLCTAAIKDICRDHPIKTLFVWPFTKEGEALARALAKECHLELRTSIRTNKN